MIDVLAVGEILIDFTENGLSGQSNKVFEANPGGAPANVLAALNKHGKKGALVAKVGNDGFGRILLSALNEAGVDSSFVAVDDSSLTTLAFVQTFDGGEREFSFYRDRTADVMLNRSDIPLDAVKDSRIIHFGSVSLSSDPARDAVHYMIEEAFKDGKFISFDPNYRPFLWHDEEEAKREVFWGISRSTLLKIADNEIEWLLGTTDYEEGAARLLSDYPDLKGITVTLGGDGSFLMTRKELVKVPTFMEVKPIEKTGAGDTFFGTFLLSVLDNGLSLPEGNDAKFALRRANAAATIITTKKGALKVMPERKEVEDLMERYPL